MDNSSNIFSYSVGALALVSAMLSAVLYYRSYLPGVQIKLLGEILQETRGIYETAAANGLLPTGMFRVKTEHKLLKLENSGSALRERAYRATTPFEEYLALVRGLSWEIMKKSHEVKKLRAFLLTTSEEERRRRRLERVPSRPPPSEGGDNHNALHTPISRETIIAADEASTFQVSLHEPVSSSPSLGHTALPFPVQLRNFAISSTSSTPCSSSALTDSDTESVAETRIPKPPRSFFRHFSFSRSSAAIKAPNERVDGHNLDVLFSQV